MMRRNSLEFLNTTMPEAGRAEKCERSEGLRNAAFPSALTWLAFFFHHRLMTVSATTARKAISDQFAWFPLRVAEASQTRKHLHLRMERP